MKALNLSVDQGVPRLRIDPHHHAVAGEGCRNRLSSFMSSHRLAKAHNSKQTQQFGQCIANKGAKYVH